MCEVFKTELSFFSLSLDFSSELLRCPYSVCVFVWMQDVRKKLGVKIFIRLLVMSLYNIR